MTRIEYFAAEVLNGLLRSTNHVHYDRLYQNAIYAAIRLDKALTEAGYPEKEEEPKSNLDKVIIQVPSREVMDALDEIKAAEKVKETPVKKVAPKKTTTRKSRAKKTEEKA